MHIPMHIGIVCIENENEKNESEKKVFYQLCISDNYKKRDFHGIHGRNWNLLELCSSGQNV